MKACRVVFLRLLDLAHKHVPISLLSAFVHMIISTATFQFFCTSAVAVTTKTTTIASTTTTAATITTITATGSDHLIVNLLHFRFLSGLLQLNNIKIVFLP